MTPELTALSLAALLQVVQLALMAIPANRELGRKATMGPRDPVPGQPPMLQQLSPVTGRLHRAMSNHFEALILFTIAVVVVTLSDGSTPLTRACGWSYLAARIAYVPAYAVGRGPWRSLSWGIALLATILMLGSALI